MKPESVGLKSTSTSVLRRSVNHISTGSNPIKKKLDCAPSTNLVLTFENFPKPEN